MPRHDLICASGHVANDVVVSDPDRLPRCFLTTCHSGTEILWTSPSSAVNVASVHPDERAVVWRHPVTGHVEFPMRNNIPMPKRYKDWGYQRVEATNLRELHAIEKATNTRNERAWFDRGSGRNFDGADC